MTKTIANEYLKKAVTLDASDKLAAFKTRFFEKEEISYLDGNSLGRLPLATRQLMSQIVDYQWGERLIRAWNEHWIEAPGRIAAKIAQLVGAQADEIFVGDSTSVNLFKLAYGALRMQKGRTKILSDELNFPSDFYVLQGLIDSWHNQHQLEILPSADGISADLDLLEKSIDTNTALICLSHVAFKSAYMYNMAKVNQMAERAEAMVIWDLSHAVGSVPVRLNESGAQLAVGCTYKYLNGGPGAPAFLYVSKQLQPALQSAIWAWFGHAEPFMFEQEFRPRNDVWKFAAGTPPMLSLAAIEPGLDLLLEAGTAAIRAKSISLSGLFLEMYHSLLQPLGFSLASPLHDDQRGSHIAVRHPEGYRICKALISPNSHERPIIPDFRRPDNIRLGFAPLYNSHLEVAQAALRLAEIVKNEIYLQYDSSQEKVT